MMAPDCTVTWNVISPLMVMVSCSKSVVRSWLSPMLTQANVRELLVYDPETGVFVWRRRPRAMFSDARTCAVWNTLYAGKRAGGFNLRGYESIRIINKAYWSHRLAWLYVTGLWPTHDIDHINGNKSDNRFANLRDVTRTTNCENRRTSHAGKILPLGVCRLKRNLAKPYTASIAVDRKKIHIGYFSSAEEAAGAYILAKRALHAGCEI